MACILYKLRYSILIKIFAQKLIKFYTYYIIISSFGISQLYNYTDVQATLTNNHFVQLRLLL